MEKRVCDRCNRDYLMFSEQEYWPGAYECICNRCYDKMKNTPAYLIGYTCLIGAIFIYIRQFSNISAYVSVVIGTLILYWTYKRDLE